MAAKGRWCKCHAMKGTEDEQCTFEQQENGLLHTAGLFRYLERGVSFHFRCGGHRKKRKMQELLHPGNRRPDRPVKYRRGQCVLQPAVWTGAGRVGAQSL
nr:MAG TPA: hypothetical protein [Caudoviricetes sp.]